MPHTRRLPQIRSTGRITIRLSTAQRDLFIKSPLIPKDLGHALHRAPVHKGDLTLRTTRSELDALIDAAANVETPDRKSEAALRTLLKYLENHADRFEEPVEIPPDEPGPAESMPYQKFE